MYKNCCIENPLVVRTASVHLPYVHVHIYTYETHESSNQENLYPSLVYAHTTQGKRKEHQHIHTLRLLKRANIHTLKLQPKDETTEKCMYSYVFTFRIMI